MKTIAIILALAAGVVFTGCTKNTLTGTMHSDFNCVFDNLTCSHAGTDSAGDAGVDADSGDAGGSDGPGGA